MKSIIYIFLCFFILVSCDDFVEIDSPTVVGQEQFFKSKTDFESAINGMYNGLKGYYSSFYQVAEIPSDNTEANGYNNSLSVMDQFVYNASTSFVQNNWIASYSNIARANVILDKINDVDFEEDLKQQFIGEAKFVRALMYFNLVQLYGDVPLVLTEIRSEEQAYSYLREPVSKVYEQIEEDLNQAVDFLPSEYSASEIGKPTRFAALGLLGKVFMTTKRFSDAIPVLEEVMDSQKFSLLSNFEDVFSVDNENNEEILFAVQYLGGSGFAEGSNFSLAFAPFGSGTEITSGGVPSGSNTGTLDLFLSFEDNDIRRSTSIALYPNSDSLYYTRKYLDRPVSTSEGDNDWPILRYADVLLLYAEALNETGSSEEALIPLNEVRERAGLNPIAELEADALASIILHERRVELCFEGHRWFDLLRTETMVPTMTAYKAKYTDIGYGVQYYEVSEEKMLFPIPFREISLNPALTQNPGY
ncbi:RagB/SusD family nutrient uptake outer membrane protein [Membranihabitans marinus]|uniref:RagB/SusD family nutrient uptake outer membrane protein n=1 Tax=Membranihabitans marinus TaxID=1227546 RepID=UPI001F3934A3|nr:RagB/SusD family nutrient uptake outer membrane protein [Membranihabitans marinus]